MCRCVLKHDNHGKGFKFLGCDRLPLLETPNFRIAFACLSLFWKAADELVVFDVQLCTLDIFFLQALPDLSRCS